MADTDTSAAPAITSYTVLAGAITITTGRLDPQTRKAEVVRAKKGDTFDAPADNPSVLTHLSMKAIRPSDAVTGKERITAAAMLRTFQKGQDDVATPLADVVPVDAPNATAGSDLPDAILAREAITV